MANNYSYQYDTSPRKLYTDYSKPKKKNVSSKKKKSVTVKDKKAKKVAPKQPAKTVKRNDNQSNEKKNELKKEKLTNLKIKFSIGCKTVLIFAAFFFILFREAQINELFSNIQKLKTSITTIQKENDQLEINIQNSINANNIEQAAKELLGMQKLTSKQTVYISLPKEDYVEHSTEEVIIGEEKNWFESFINNIKNIIEKK